MLDRRRQQLCLARVVDCAAVDQRLGGHGNPILVIPAKAGIPLLALASERQLDPGIRRDFDRFRGRYSFTTFERLSLPAPA